MDNDYQCYLDLARLALAVGKFIRWLNNNKGHQTRNTERVVVLTCVIRLYKDTKLCELRQPISNLSTAVLTNKVIVESDTQKKTAQKEIKGA